MTCHGFWEGEGDARHIKDLKVFFQQCGSSTSCIYTAILIFEDLLDIDPLAGHCFEDAELLQQELYLRK